MDVARPMKPLGRHLMHTNNLCLDPAQRGPVPNAPLLNRRVGEQLARLSMLHIDTKCSLLPHNLVYKLLM